MFVVQINEKSISKKKFEAMLVSQNIEHQFLDIDETEMPTGYISLDEFSSRLEKRIRKHYEKV